MSKQNDILEQIRNLVDTMPSETQDALLQDIQTHTNSMESPRMLAYKKVREENTALNGELVDLLADADYMAAARALDSIEGEDFIYHEEIEIDYRLDFLLFDFRAHDGKTLVQRQWEQTDDLNTTKQMLAIYNAARTSLYAVVAVNRIECTITLRNLLKKAEPLITVTDMGLSRTVKVQHHILFTRIIHYPEFNTCSGMVMVFPQRKYDKLYKAFEKRYKKLPTNLSPAEKRFIAFFHVNREFGEQVKTVQN